MNFELKYWNLKTGFIFFFVISYILISYFSSEIIIDDALITFKYAKNFAEFFKPWYNLEPILQGNGQTSLLWMWILALFNFLGLRSEDIFLTINIFIGSFLIIKLLQNLEFSRKKLLLFFFNTILSIFFTYWLYLNSGHGLESVLATFILYLFLKNWDKNINYFAILLPLVRPEFAIFLVFWSLNIPLFSKEFYKRSLISFCGIFIFALFYFAFFDFYIPLPFLYKSSFSTYNFPLFSVYCGLLLIFIPILFSLLNKKKFLLFIAINILLIYYTFNVQSYSSSIFVRYYFPLMSFYMVFKFHPENFKKYYKKAPFILNVLMILCVLRMMDLSRNYYKQRQQIQLDNIGYYQAYENLVNILKKTDKATVIDAGYTAYFSNAKIFDGAGLNDATIMTARKENDPIAYRKYVEDQKINVVSICSTSKTNFDSRSKHEQFIYNSLHLKNYKPQYIFPMDKGYFLFVYQFDGGYKDQ